MYADPSPATMQIEYANARKKVHCGTISRNVDVYKASAKNKSKQESCSNETDRDSQKTYQQTFSSTFKDA